MLPSGAGQLKVSLAFRKSGDYESTTRFGYPRITQAPYATNSQTTPRAQPRAENSQPASQGSLNQHIVPHHVQADTASPIVKQNVKKSLNVSNPSTPKKKKNFKKPKNQTPIRKDGASSVDTQPHVAKPVSQIPHTPGSRSEGKEVDKGAVGAHGRATSPDQVIASTQPVAEVSSKENENHSKQEGDVAGMALVALPATAEDISNPVNHKQNFPRMNDSHVNQEQLNILDGSPTRKPRNISSSRKTSQPQSQSSPTETRDQVISGNSVVQDLSEDQWPALQRPSPSPKEGQHEHVIITKRLNYRAISLKTTLEVKPEAFSTATMTKKKVNDPEGPINAASKVETPILTRAKSSDRGGHLNETLRTTGADHNSGDVNRRNVTFPGNIRIRVPTTPIPTEASRETSSAGGYNSTDLPSYSQTECSNSWAEDSEQADISSPRNSNSRGNTTTKPVLDVVRDKSQIPYISSVSEMKQMEANSPSGRVPLHGDRALSSDVGIELDTAPYIDKTAQDTATISIPKVDDQQPLSEAHEENHEKTKKNSSITTRVTSCVANCDTDTKLSSRAKGKQKVLTIEVPPRELQSRSLHSVPSPPSASPKYSKSKQHLEVRELSTSSSIPVPSPAISTHMKKKTKKITPPRKTSRTTAPTEKDMKTGKSVITGTEPGTLDGSSKDVTSSAPILEQERLMDAHEPNTSNSEVSETIQATVVDLTGDQDEGASDETQHDERPTVDPAQSDGQDSRIRSYPAPDPSNAVYVSELRGPSIAKRKSTDLAQPSSDSQLSQGRSYPAPDPSSAVYVAGRFPARMIFLEHLNRIEDEKVVATPPSSPDMPIKKDQAKAKKNKKRKSKTHADHQNISESQSIMPFPKPKVQSAAFPTLPLDEPSPTGAPSHENSEVGIEVSDPFGVLDPTLDVEQIGHHESGNTGVWTDAVIEKRSDITAMMTVKSKAKSFDIEAFDKEDQEFRKRKSPLDSELLQHIGIMGGNGIGLTVDTTSEDRDNSSIDSTKQDVTGDLLSTRSSVNDYGSTPELTRGSSIVSSSSNIIFPDVPAYMPRPISTILAPVNLTHDPEFDSSSLETSNLKARPPRHHPEFDSDIFDRPAVRVESPHKSPLAAEFGTGSFSATFEPDIEQKDIAREAFTPIPSPVKPIFSLDLLGVPSTGLEAPIKKMKLSGEAESSSAVPGFEHKSLNKAEDSGYRPEEVEASGAVADVQSLLSAESDVKSQFSDHSKPVTEDKSSPEVDTLQAVETIGEVQTTEDVEPSGIYDIHNTISNIKLRLSAEAALASQRLKNSKSVEAITGEKIGSSEEVKSLENMKLEHDVNPENEVELEDEALSRNADGNDTIPAESGSLTGPSKVVGRPSTSADIEDLRSAKQHSPTKIAEDAEPFSAISETSTVKTAFPPLPSGSFPTTADSPPKLSEANVAAHTVATDSDDAREERRARNESISEWSTTSSFRRKTYSEAANIPSPTRRSRGQSMVGAAPREGESCVC